MHTGFFRLLAPAHSGMHICIVANAVHVVEADQSDAFDWQYIYMQGYYSTTSVSLMVMT